MARRIDNRSYYAVLLLAVLFSFVAHELAHWGAGEALGLDMTMSLNRAYVAGGAASPRDALIIGLAGPIFTIVQALVAAVFLWRGAVLAYAFVFAAFMMRLSATFVSFALPNDEMRASVALGLGAWTLPALVTLGLLALTIAASRRLGIGWRTNLLSYMVTSLATAAIVFSDRLF